MSNYLKWFLALISAFGVTNHHDSQLSFGIDRGDRNRHLYIIGKTGMGKSKLIQLLALADITAGKGVCIIDPHGDLAQEILPQIPTERVDDVIYFNPADKAYPIGFNPLACPNPESKHQTVTSFIAIFKKLFGATWNNRLEHMLRFIVLALVEGGNCTIVDIVSLLTNTQFRQQLITKIQDPVVKNFWTHEFKAWNERFDNEAIIPIINQVGQFIANDYIRYTVGQPQSGFDFFELMQQQKILVVNLAKGKLGEENTALLGSMMISKIQEATMARVSLAPEKRQEFYLYVDEFQHFATDAFTQILSEARKFNLSLTIAHQYLDQLTDTIRKTVFGNVGSFAAFRVGPEDAGFLATEFAPKISQHDLINLDFRNMYVKLSIAGKTSPAFSAATLTVSASSRDNSEAIVAHSRHTYATPLNQVEAALNQDPQALRLVAASTPPPPEFEEPVVQ